MPLLRVLGGKRCSWSRTRGRSGKSMSGGGSASKKEHIEKSAAHQGSASFWFLRRQQRKRRSKRTIWPVGVLPI